MVERHDDGPGSWLVRWLVEDDGGDAADTTADWTPVTRRRTRALTGRR